MASVFGESPFDLHAHGLGGNGSGNGSGDANGNGDGSGAIFHCADAFVTVVAVDGTHAKPVQVQRRGGLGMRTCLYATHHMNNTTHTHAHAHAHTLMHAHTHTHACACACAYACGSEWGWAEGVACGTSRTRSCACTHMQCVRVRLAQQHALPSAHPHSCQGMQSHAFRSRARQACRRVVHRHRTAAARCYTG